MLVVGAGQKAKTSLSALEVTTSCWYVRKALARPFAKPPHGGRWIGHSPLEKGNLDLRHDVVHGGDHDLLGR
jgi:hypothetical protein